MKRWLVAGTLGLATVCALMTSCASGNTAAVSGDDEQAVREAAAKFYSALNVMFSGDAGPMKDVWSHAADVTYMGPGGGLTPSIPELPRVYQLTGTFVADAAALR